MGNGPRTVVALACVVLFMGCAARKKWYVVGYDLSARSTDFGEARFPPASALALLSKAKVVAFAPPDECEDTSDTKVVGMRCGEVMSGLEDAAIEAGYQVVSWQALRGDQPALTYARSNGVDVLFNVNRLSLDSSQGDLTSSGELRFAEVSANGSEKPIAVPSSVQQRCRDMLLSGVASTAAGATSVMLDVSMVNVDNGQTLWNYRRLFTRALFTEGSDRLYYTAKTPKASIRNVLGWALGGSLLGSGAVFLILGASIGVDGFVTPGIILAVIGGGALAIGGRKANLPASKALCVPDQYVDDPFAPTGNAPAETGGSSDRASFQATIAGNRDDALLRQVSRAAASGFVELLVFLQATQPPVKKHAALKRPSKPKDMREKRDANCDWLQSKKNDLGKEAYARFLRKYPECK